MVHDSTSCVDRAAEMMETFNFGSSIADRSLPLNVASRRRVFGDRAWRIISVPVPGAGVSVDRLTREV